MGKTPSKPEDYRRKQHEETKKMIKKKGVEGAQIVMKEKLGEWKNVKIKFGVTGLSGAGKSSYINSIRGYGKSLRFVVVRLMLIDVYMIKGRDN
jgi:ribosome biogenesis GTPase A